MSSVKQFEIQDNGLQKLKKKTAKRKSFDYIFQALMQFQEE